MVSLVALIIWRLNFLIVLSGFLVFGMLDGLYLTSALTKVSDGAWFTLGLAVILSSIFILWRYGKENQWRAEGEDHFPPSYMLTEQSQIGEKDGSAPTLHLAPEFGGATVSRLRGVGVFFDKTGSPHGTPTVFVHFLQKFQATTAVVVFFHIRPLSTPTVAPEDRFSVSRCFPLASASTTTLQHMYRVTIRHGYTDNVLTTDLGLLIYENLRAFIVREASHTNFPNPTIASENSSSSTSTAPPTDNHANNEYHPPTLRQSLNTLQSAYEDQVVHIVGKEQMRIGTVHNAQGWARSVALAAFLWLRSNTGSKVANMNLDVEKLVEVGFVKVI